jgi:hypothetical protein
VTEARESAHTLVLTAHSVRSVVPVEACMIELYSYSLSCIKKQGKDPPPHTDTPRAFYSREYPVGPYQGRLGKTFLSNFLSFMPCRCRCIARRCFRMMVSTSLEELHPAGIVHAEAIAAVSSSALFFAKTASLHLHLTT